MSVSNEPDGLEGRQGLLSLVKPHLGENAKQESKCYVRNPSVQGNTAIHGTPGDGGLLSPHGSRNYACVMSIPDLFAVITGA